MSKFGTPLPNSVPVSATYCFHNYQRSHDIERYGQDHSYRALIDVQAVCAAAFTPLRRRNIGLAIIESGLRRADVDNIDGDAIAHPANGGSAVTAFVAYLKAFAASCRWACGTFIARNGLLPIA